MEQTTERAPSLIARSVENLVTVIGAALPSFRGRRVHSGASDGFVAVAVLMGAVLTAILQAGMEGIASYAVSTVGLLLFGTVCAAAVGFVSRRDVDAGEVVVGLLWALVIGVGLAGLAWQSSAFGTNVGIWLLAGAFGLPAMLFLIGRFGPVTGAASLSALGAVLTVAIFGAPDSASETMAIPPDTEAVYAAQPSLLAREAARLTPGSPGRTELFAVLGAGYPSEAVFEREVLAVSDLLDDRFGAQGRSIRLINNDSAVIDFPVLNKGNLQSALSAAAGAMNVDEDILLLFLTSHGHTGILSTRFDGVTTRDLRPRDVASALDESGVQNAIVIVSACYSGSFVDALSGPNRLVLTAAAADRNSFGCADENEWTEWGRAFFVDAWPKLPDPRDAAREAARLAAEREAERDLTASLPQIVEGRNIGAAIERWLAELQDD